MHTCIRTYPMHKNKASTGLSQTDLLQDNYRSVFETVNFILLICCMPVIELPQVLHAIQFTKILQLFKCIYGPIVEWIASYVKCSLCFIVYQSLAQLIPQAFIQGWNVEDGIHREPQSCRLILRQNLKQPNCCMLMPFSAPQSHKPAKSIYNRSCLLAENVNKIVLVAENLKQLLSHDFVDHYHNLLHLHLFCFADLLQLASTQVCKRLNHQRTVSTTISSLNYIHYC